MLQHVLDLPVFVFQNVKSLFLFSFFFEMTQKPKTMHQASHPQAKNLQQNQHCHASMAIAKLKATG